MIIIGRCLAFLRRRWDLSLGRCLARKSIGLERIAPIKEIVYLPVISITGIDGFFFFGDFEDEEEEEIVVSERLLDDDDEEEDDDELDRLLLVERELDVLELDRFRFDPLSNETTDDELKRMGRRQCRWDAKKNKLPCFSPFRRWTSSARLCRDISLLRRSKQPKQSSTYSHLHTYVERFEGKLGPYSSLRTASFF